MAPLPPSNTPRYNVFYTVTGGEQHSMQFRAPAPVSPAALGIFVQGFFFNISTSLYQVTIDYVEWAPAGSDIFNVVTTGAEGAVYGTGSQPAIARPLMVTFTGRSSGGRRGRVMVFGWIPTDTTWRFNAGENAQVDAGVAALSGASGYPLAIDGTEIVWHSYANVKNHDHYVKEARI